MLAAKKPTLGALHIVYEWGLVDLGVQRFDSVRMGDCIRVLRIELSYANFPETDRGVQTLISVPFIGRYKGMI